MKKTIRMTKLHASPHAVREAGRTYKVDKAEADRLIRSGAALLVNKPASQQQTGPPAAAAEPSEGSEPDGSELDELEQPELSTSEPSDGGDHTCQECGYEAKSAAGLANHQRSHADDNDDGDDSEWTDEA